MQKATANPLLFLGSQRIIVPDSFVYNEKEKCPF